MLSAGVCQDHGAEDEPIAYSGRIRKSMKSKKLSGIHSNGEVRVRWPEARNALPKEIFHREDIYRRELQRIFYGPDWHPLAHLAEIPRRGDFKSFRLGEAPVLIVHGDDDQVRVFANSCTHRGTQIEVRALGNKSEFECPYHRWLFNNCGKLIAAPGSDRFPEDFRKQDYSLRELRCDQFRGLIFATCDPQAPTLDSYLGEIKDMLAKVMGGDGRLRLLGYQKASFDSNWKEYQDNDGYHAPLLHRAFQLLKWQAGRGNAVATAYGHMGIEANLKELANASFLRDPSIVEFKQANAPLTSIAMGLFPITVIVKHLDVINLRFAFPRSVDEVEVHYAYFCHLDDGDEMMTHRLRQSSNLLGPCGFISLEDGAIFNRLHTGSNTFGDVMYQKGVGDLSGEPPYSLQQNDEATNVIKWKHYRELMGFDQ
jgi:anthranilate 1,2-dioxygenase large subunit